MFFSVKAKDYDHVIIRLRKHKVLEKFSYPASEKGKLSDRR